MANVDVTCSLLTPGGAGAIAAVSVKGAAAWRLVRQCVRRGTAILPEHPVPGKLYLGTFYDHDEALDEVVVAATPGGTDVELSCHGGTRVVERIVLRMTTLGAIWRRPSEARRSEADWRACLKATAFEGLARTTTRRGTRFLLRQADLLTDELGDIISAARAERLTEACESLGALLARSRGAWHLHHPADVAVIGLPNAGKSLLANRLAGKSEAIVTERAGTTRDWLALRAAFDGVPVHLIDTAGVRETSDALEHLAIGAGRRRAGEADAYILVVDGSLPADESVDLWNALPANRTVVAHNKSDLSTHRTCDRPGYRNIAVSAVTGTGMPELTHAILECVLDMRILSETDMSFVFCRNLAVRLRNALESAELTGIGLAESIEVACCG